MVNRKLIITAIEVTILVAVGLLIGRLCTSPKPDSAQSDLLQAKLDSMKTEYAIIEGDNSRLHDSIRLYGELVDKKTAEIAEVDSIYRAKQQEYRVEIAKIRAATDAQIDSLLNKRYADVDEDQRSRAIMTDLAEGDSCCALLPKALEKISLQESKIAMLESVSFSKDTLIKNLKRQVAIRNEENLILQAQYADLVKHDRKMKRQRNGLGVVAFLALISGVVF